MEGGIGMRMRTLGGTGIKVSAYCLGAMMFGQWGNPDHDDSIAIIHAALDGGINFIDTADAYSGGESEEIVGNALSGRRDDVVLATKVHFPMSPDPNSRGSSRRWIVREAENSLRRLRTDYIDLYQVHRPDPDTDIEETLSALSDLVHSGKVRAIGSSTFPAEQIVEAQWVADRRGYVRFRCEQPPYSIFARGIESAVLPTCQRYGMGAITWSPLAAGWLTGRYRAEGGVDMTGHRAARMPARFDPSLPGNAAKLTAVEELIKLAADAGCSLTHLALAFVTGHPAVTAAIIGPRTMDQLTDLLAGAAITLTDDVLDQIDRIVPPGVTLNTPDAGWQPPSLTDAPHRRRPTDSRSAA
jgi:aryl-alcohol dehydrogenase-like predicted oxidoreductase